jgi:hypothetical protein
VVRHCSTDDSIKERSAGLHNTVKGIEWDESRVTPMGFNTGRSCMNLTCIQRCVVSRSQLGMDSEVKKWERNGSKCTTLPEACCVI